MIQSLKIINFQSHEDSTLDFVPGVNMILGASDSGKSAIIRALKWLVWNRPNGDAYRSNWGGETSVQAFFDGFGVERSKDKENMYRIFEEDTNKADIILKAFK